MRKIQQKKTRLKMEGKTCEQERYIYNPTTQEELIVLCILCDMNQIY